MNNGLAVLAFSESGMSDCILSWTLRATFDGCLDEDLGAAPTAASTEAPIVSQQLHLQRPVGLHLSSLLRPRSIATGALAGFSFATSQSSWLLKHV